MNTTAAKSKALFSYNDQATFNSQPTRVNLFTVDTTIESRLQSPYHSQIALLTHGVNMRPTKGTPSVSQKCSNTPSASVSLSARRNDPWKSQWK